ncbi:MAG: hypothetical protein HY294_06485 [Candidatus Rokubacteria bacterium]|nr:hypothetical protein [Candidatus Rokubacteria bacterium]
MPTTSLTVRYRPLRIGFVVQPGDVGALVKIATLNSLLWGGIYNPILPAGQDSSLLKQLIELFSVDLLTPVGETAAIKAVLDSYPYLRTPGHFADEIFFEDWHTKKLDLGILDIIHIVDHYWDVEFRHKPPDFKSNCLLLDWADDDPCATLFALSFGALPSADQEKLKYDFRKAFERGLRAEVTSLPRGGPVPAALTEKITPLRLTGDRLQQWGGSLRDDDGIYIGRAGDFDDLVAFWNLRAAGTSLRYLPYDHLDRFHDYIQTWLHHLDAIPTRPPLDRAWIGVHWRDDPAVDVPALIGRFAIQKQRMLSRYDPVIWNGLNVIPSQFYLSSQSVLASVDRHYERSTVSFALPAKPVSNDPYGRHTGFQHLAAVVSPLVEFEYPDRTLKPPPLRGLDEFLSREIAFDPWKLRTDPEGLALTIQLHDSSESLYPVPHHDLLRKLLELHGIEAELSTAGILADRIITQMREMRPLDACRVFKIPGVRRLIKDLRASDTITWKAALQAIGKEGFGRFKKLYIESRKTPELTPVDVLTFLMKKEILRPRLCVWPRILRRQREVRCGHCGLTTRVLLRAFEGIWRCGYCMHEEDLGVRIATDFRGDRPEWVFAKSGLFAKDNHQEGAIPVILTLLQFLRVLDSAHFMYSTALNLEFKNHKCETDLVVLSHGPRGQIELAIGECKDEHGLITEKDVTNLRLAWKQFENSKVTCHLIFAKTTESFTVDELRLFRSLESDRIPVILLTNRELEPYNPYWDAEADIPTKYALSLLDMTRNSVARYLSPTTTS